MMRRFGLWLLYVCGSAIFGVGWFILLSLPISVCTQVLGGWWTEPIQFRAISYPIATMAFASMVTSLLFARAIRKATTFGERFGLSFLFAATLAVIWCEFFGLVGSLVQWLSNEAIWKLLNINLYDIASVLLEIAWLAGYALVYAAASFYIVLPFATVQIWALRRVDRLFGRTK